MTQQLHLAKIIITNDEAPIINGALLVQDSKIIKVGKKEDFGDLNNLNAKIIDHSESLICPGFINLHTHLLYSSIKELNGSDGLFPWLEKLVDNTTTFSEKDYIDSVNLGIKGAISSGTTYIVENTPNHLSAKLLSTSPLKATVGLEVFGSDETQAEQSFSKAIFDLENLKNELLHNSQLDFTFSPHAPYDVSISLWKKLINWSKENSKPLLTHLEESPQEKLWWKNKSGPAKDFWRKISKLEPKVKYWKPYTSGIDFLSKNNLLDSEIIGTHLSQATKEDLLLLKEHNIKLIHCPRSNFYLNNGTANLSLWNKLGFLWGIGTDSTASNSDLDLLEEIKFALKQQSLIYNYSISAKEAFESITLKAARIISKNNEIGYLKSGYSSDFLVFNIKEESGCTYKDPYHLLIWEANTKDDLKEVWINGKKVWIAEHLLHKI